MASKTYIFTLNNYTDDEVDFFTNRIDGVNRLVVSKEVGENGTPHLQGYVTWQRAKRLSALKKLVPRAHWEASTRKDVSYEKKVGSIVIVDVDNAKQGARNDIQGAMALVRDKRPRLELMESYPTVVARYEPFLRAYGAESRRYEGDRHVVWAWGPTGVGKSFLYRQVFAGKFKKVRFSGRRFVQGYSGEDVVVFDEFRDDHYPFWELLSLFDSGAQDVDVKGGEIAWNARLIYVTTPFHPSEMYEYIREDRQQLLRRVQHIYHFPAEADECRRTLQGYLDASEAPSS